MNKTIAMLLGSMVFLAPISVSAFVIDTSVILKTIDSQVFTDTATSTNDRATANVTEVNGTGIGNADAYAGGFHEETFAGLNSGGGVATNDVTASTKWSTTITNTSAINQGWLFDFAVPLGTEVV